MNTGRMLIEAELKLAAIQAGASDYSDVLVLADRAGITIGGGLNVTGAVEAVAKLKAAKPHLFQRVRSSSGGAAPDPRISEPMRVRGMSESDYAKARASITGQSRGSISSGKS